MLEHSYARVHVGSERPRRHLGILVWYFDMLLDLCVWVQVGTLTHSLTHHTLHITVECRQAYATPPNKWEGGIG